MQKQFTIHLFRQEQCLEFTGSFQQLLNKICMNDLLQLCNRNELDIGLNIYEFISALKQKKEFYSLHEVFGNHNIVALV